MCRGDHWSPAHLPPQRIFRDGFLARQTGTGEQCSPLQAFFGSSAEGSRPLPTEQKEKSASKETCPGQINPAPAHKRQSCNNGKAAGRALGGAQRAPPVCKQTRSCGCLPRRGKHCSLHAHNPAMPGPYASVCLNAFHSYLLTLFRCSPCPKLQSCLHNKRSPLWKKSKQARSAARPRRKASASATPPCANGCASMNPRAQTALRPGKSPATLPQRKSRPPWRSTSRAGSRCLTSAKSTASAARKTCKNSWKRRRRAASCAATTARPATGAARTPPPQTGKRSCGNAWPTAAITAQLR